MKMHNVTRNQHKVYNYIIGYRKKHGYSPSYGDILKALKLKSRGNLAAVIDALCTKKLLKKDYGQHRSVRGYDETND